MNIDERIEHELEALAIAIFPGERRIETCKNQMNNVGLEIERASKKLTLELVEKVRCPNQFVNQVYHELLIRRQHPTSSAKRLRKSRCGVVW